MSRSGVSIVRLMLTRALGNASFCFGALGLLTILTVAILAPYIAPHGPNEQDLLNVLVPPVWADGGSWSYPLGTDSLGQGVLSRLIYGARVVVIIAITAPLGAALVGSVLAVLAGYCGGWLDWVISRWVDAWLSFPAVVLALIFVVALSPSLVNVILAIVLVDWTRFCRVLRAEVVAVTRKEFVLASRIAGASHFLVIARDILPALVPTLIALMALEVSIAVVAESVLSFVGMSVGSDTPTWGGMIADGLSSIYSAATPVFVPMLCLVMTVLFASFCGQGLREATDVRLMERTTAT